MRATPPTALSLAGREGLSVRFPESTLWYRQRRRALGGKWRCTLDLPADKMRDSAMQSQRAWGARLTLAPRRVVAGGALKRV